MTRAPHMLLLLSHPPVCPALAERGCAAERVDLFSRFSQVKKFSKNLRWTYFIFFKNNTASTEVDSTAVSTFLFGASMDGPSMMVTHAARIS